MRKHRKTWVLLLFVTMFSPLLFPTHQYLLYAQESDLGGRDLPAHVDKLRELAIGLHAQELVGEQFDHADKIAREAIRSMDHALWIQDEATRAFGVVLFDLLNFKILQRAMEVLMENEDRIDHENMTSSMQQLEETRHVLESQMEADDVPFEELVLMVGNGIAQAYDIAGIDLDAIGLPGDLVNKLVPGIKIQPIAKDYTFEGGVKTQKGSPTGSQDVLVIFVRASDNNTSNLVNLRTSEQAEFTNISTFYDESSFNQLSFRYTWAPQTNWYQLSKSYDNYIWTNADVNSAPAGSKQRAKAQSNLNTVQGFLTFATEVMQEVQDDSYNISDYDQIVIVIIGGFLRGESSWPFTYTLKDNKGKSFQVKTTVLVVSTNTNWSRTAHEFGHAFGRWPDSYYSSTRRPGQWDLMDCTDCGAQTPGWNKDYKAGWYKGTHASKLKSITRPTGSNKKTDKTTLVPYASRNAPAGSVQSLRLDVGGGLHLYVENRQIIAGNTSEQNIPGSGIVIIDAMDDVKNVNVHRDFIQLYGGPITSGNTFKDQAYGDLKIEVSGSAPNLDVKTSWGPDPYVDLYITPWYSPPWESPDIWIDSPVNGWDTYEYNDASKNPGVTGNPIRNGDRPQVNKINRLYAKISNIGTKDVNNVKVSFYVTEPQGIGQQNATWVLIDRVTIPTVRGGRSVVSPPVSFKPTASSHTCIKVVIEYQSGELNANNNVAFENISDFNTTAASPWKPIENQLLVENPFNTYKEIIMEMVDLPKDWKGWISDRVIGLQPKESKLIKYSINPGLGGQLDLGSAVDINVVGYYKDNKNYSPLGGVTSAVHLVEKSSISIDVPGSVSYDDLAGLIAIVNYEPKYSGIPIALEISELNTDVSSMYSTITTLAGQMQFNIFQLISSGNLMNLEPGKKYKVQAFLYGNQSVDNAVSSEALINILP